MQSAIYRGELRHRRFFPKRHEFTYSTTLFYLDLDELPGLFSESMFWSLNRWNLGSFHRTDYLGDPAVPLADAVRDRACELAGYCPDGPVRMLTNLRIWGFCFNPVTFYFLFGKGEQHPELIVAEVNNTPWKERHSYLVKCDSETGKTRSNFAKQFHVSPFNPLAMEYRWVSTAPGESLLVHMENHGGMASTGLNGLHMDATLRLQRNPWSSSLLNKILWLHPWNSIKVPLAIYWQALKLLVKGVPVYDHVDLITTGEKP